MNDKYYKGEYSGNWRNVKEDCMLCRMPKKTHWYIETPDFVVAEKLGGGPFIVAKHHTKELEPHDQQKAQRLLELLFGEGVETRVLMNLVEDHWHAHILADGEDIDLSDE